METFSFSVSHDLKAPLRHMRGFMELLQKRMEGQLDEKSRHYAVLISDAAKKMEHLITDLLSLARLGRLELQKREVDINNLVKRLLISFQRKRSSGTLHGNLVSCRLSMVKSHC